MATAAAEAAARAEGKADGSVQPNPNLRATAARTTPVASGWRAPTRVAAPRAAEAAGASAVAARG